MSFASPAFIPHDRRQHKRAVARLSGYGKALATALSTRLDCISFNRIYFIHLVHRGSLCSQMYSGSQMNSIKLDALWMTPANKHFRGLPAKVGKSTMGQQEILGRFEKELNRLASETNI